MVKRVNQSVQEPISPVQQSNSLKMKLDKMNIIKPLTKNQTEFFKSYDLGNYFIALLGSPGTGKTFIALYKALVEVLDKGNSYNKITLIRSAVQTRDSGFLPGDIDEKMAIYEEPYHYICSNLFNRKDAYQRLKEQNYIEFTSTTALRGMTFDNSIIIVDECQSMTYHELNTIISRVGNESKIMFVGDMKQNDLIKKSSDVSGLPHFINIASTMECFYKITFTPEDIVRSSLVKSWIIASEKYEESN